MICSCQGMIIAPGLIDIHAHFREPGFEYKESISSGSSSAFFGGYTRVCTMPNTDPVIDNPELISNIINKSTILPIYIHPIGAVTKNQKGLELSEIGEMVKENEALYLVDCVTSLGGMNVKMDDWNIDALYSGTQKCLSCPPGLAPVSFSDRAVEK